MFRPPRICDDIQVKGKEKRIFNTNERTTSLPPPQTLLVIFSSYVNDKYNTTPFYIIVIVTKSKSIDRCMEV